MAAKQVVERSNTLGVVGSALVYEYDRNGNAISIQPSRQLEATTTSGPSVLTQEIHKIAAKHRMPPDMAVWREPKPL